MGWRLVGKPKTQEVTLDLAMKFQSMEPAVEDRPLSELRLKVYEKIWRSDGFRPIHWAAAYCKETGGTQRVNGKHTSHLASSLPLAEMPPLFAVVEYYECDTLQDVAALYSTFDSRMQARSVRDINASFKSTVPQLHDVTLTLTSLCVSGIAMGTASCSKEVYNKTQPQDRAEAMIIHHDFILWCHNLHLPRHLKRAAVIAAMYVTWQKAPRIATEFWTMVKEETGATPDEPTRKLARYLLVGILGKNRKEGRSQRLKRTPDKEYFVKCLRAWNSYRSGEPTNLNYDPTKPAPTVK